MKHAFFPLACAIVMVAAAPALAAGSAAVTVKDALGRPLAGADVRLVSPGGLTAASGTTDADGRVSLPAAAGGYTVVAEKPGFKRAEAPVTLADQALDVGLTLAAADALDLKVSSERLNRARNGLSPSVGATVTHIDQPAIAALPRGDASGLNQVLLTAPGVVQDSYGQVHVRGDHGNLQYRLNGILIPDGISGFGNNFDTRFVERLDLLTGALPAQYGYRTAGVVDLHTKSGALTPGGKVELQGGSHLDLEPSLELGGSAGPVDYFLTGSYVQNGLGLENPTPDTEALHDQTKQGKAFGYVSSLLGESMRLSAIAGTAVQSFQVPTLPGQDPGNTVAGVAPVPSQDVNDLLTPANHFGILALQGSLGDKVDYQLAGFTRYASLSYTPDVNGDLQYAGQAAAITHTSLLGGIQGDGAYRFAPGHTLRYGTYLSAENAAQNNTSQVFPADDQGKQTSQTPTTVVDDNAVNTYLLGLYAQDEWKLAERLTLNYGLRMDWEDGFVQTNELQPRVGLVYQPLDATTLHAGYARYFTPPATELIAATTATRFAGTTAALSSQPGDQFLPVPERAHYYDVGVLQTLLPGLTVGLDGYYKDVQAIQDEGQFGKALIYSVFNYQTGQLAGGELSAAYRRGDLNAYANLTLSQALGKGLLTGQYNFADDERAYIADNWIHLDHDQLLSASAGVSYVFWGTRVGLSGLYGSGLRKGDENTETVPPYYQLDLGASHAFDLPWFGSLELRGSVVNALDASYQLRDDSGIGVEAPQYGPRRAYYLGVAKSF